MIAFIDEQVRKNCWNLYDSYGEICVHCGCCAKDKKTRYAARLETVREWLEEKQKFDRWDDDPEVRALQERNVKIDVKHYKRLVRYYTRKLEEMRA